MPGWVLQLADAAIGFFVSAALFFALEAIFAARKSQRRWRKGSGTDVTNWVLTPFVIKGSTSGALALFLLSVRSMPEDQANVLMRGLAYGRGPVAEQPLWLIVLEMLLLADFLTYWFHRLFHRRPFWRFHAIHHSSEQVDWLSSVRMHPVDDVLARFVQAIPLMLLGFPIILFSTYLMFLPLYVMLTHANLPWRFGLLRYVIVSPAFHRWHHTAENEGLNKNFARFFPFLDLIFGTFYLPMDRQPVDFGIADNDVPEGYLRQLLHPFRSRSRSMAPVS